jgi:hypothetical protein
MEISLTEFKETLSNIIWGIWNSLFIFIREFCLITNQYVCNPNCPTSLCKAVYGIHEISMYGHT